MTQMTLPELRHAEPLHDMQSSGCQCVLVRFLYWGYQNEEPLFGSPYNEDLNMLGSVLGLSIFGNSHVNSCSFLSQLENLKLFLLPYFGPYEQV